MSLFEKAVKLWQEAVDFDSFILPFIEGNDTLVSSVLARIERIVGSQALETYFVWGSEVVENKQEGSFKELHRLTKTASEAKMNIIISLRTEPGFSGHFFDELFNQYTDRLNEILSLNEELYMDQTVELLLAPVNA